MNFQELKIKSVYLYLFVIIMLIFNEIVLFVINYLTINLKYNIYFKIRTLK